MKTKSSQSHNTALKWINKYAEQYKQIEEEKKELLQDIKDLKSNLKISKTIIDSLYKNNLPQDEKIKIVTAKTQEEIQILNKKIKKWSGQLATSREKLWYYEQIFNKSITDYHESTDSLKSKIFILENKNVKNESIINQLILRIQKYDSEFNEKYKDHVFNPIEFDNYNNNINCNTSNYYDKYLKPADPKHRQSTKQKQSPSGSSDSDDDDDVSYSINMNQKKEYTKVYLREIYIFEPSESLNIIQNDWLWYQKAYNTALHKIKENNLLLHQKDVKIEKLQSQWLKYQTQSNLNSRDTTSNTNTNTNTNVNFDNITAKAVKQKKLKTILGLDVLNKDDISYLWFNDIGAKVLGTIENVWYDYSKKIEYLTMKNEAWGNDNISLLKSVLNLKKIIQDKKAVHAKDLSNIYTNTNISMLGNTSFEEKAHKRFTGKSIVNNSMDGFEFHYENLDFSCIGYETLVRGRWNKSHKNIKHMKLEL